MSDRESVPSARLDERRRRDEPRKEVQENNKSLGLLHPDLDALGNQARTAVPEDFEQVVNSETATARSAPLGIHEEGSSIAVFDPENGFAKKDIIYVDFDQDDKENPATFSRRKKWAITICASAFTGLSASAGSTFAIGNKSLEADLNATPLQAAAGLSTFLLGFGTIPLVTASFSEDLGRRPLYLGSCLISFLMHIGIALSQNIQTVLVLRFIQGAAGSTAATMVGGTVADIWAPAERGFPMAIYAWGAIGSTGLGPALGGYIEYNPHLQWRWIQWIYAMASGVFIFFAYFILAETRAGIILSRRAEKLRKKTGDMRFRARSEEAAHVKLSLLIWRNSTRPLVLLFTEPIVTSFSLWIGFAWGIFYGQVESIALVFRTLYGFNEGQVGLMYLSMVLGSFLALGYNFYQERLYRKYVSRRGPEARLYSACLAAVLFPLGCFIYGWTSFPQVPWIAPFIGLTVFIFAIFAIYLAVFSYLADVYASYASCALAGQSLCRFLAGTAFPLFSNHMYTTLSFKWASTLLGGIAVLMAPIPFVLMIWGPKIRAKSVFASALLQNAEVVEDEVKGVVETEGRTRGDGDGEDLEKGH